MLCFVHVPVQAKDTKVELYSHSLMVRTTGFHPVNRGSIPRGCTKFQFHGCRRVWQQTVNLCRKTS